MRGPPIRITCECGEARSLPYGERWKCERCGRRWNTEQIPAEDYRTFVRAIRRDRLVPIAIAAVIAAALLTVALVVNQGLVFTIPILLAFLAIFSGPFWKRRQRERIADRPRWELHPE
jgi:hypothetical protein